MDALLIEVREKEKPLAGLQKVDPAGLEPATF
jgi:hypothetical protein